VTFAAAAVIGSAVVGGVVASKSAKKAANAQTQAAQMGIDEQRTQFEAMQALLAPYVGVGTSALGQQVALMGGSGVGPQRDAIQAIEGGEEFAALTRQGENAILQNASATGGLRGGNTQDALAQFRPQVLSALIDQQYNRLGGLTSMGQSSAAGQAAMGQQAGNNISNLMQQQGAAQAGGALAQGQAWGNVFGQVSQLGGAMLTGAIANPFGGLGNTGTALAPQQSIRPMGRTF